MSDVYRDLVMRGGMPDTGFANSQEWPDYYDAAQVEDLRRFFDHYLKGADNGWEQTPRVRYAVLDLAGGDRVNQPARAFPPEDVTDTKYYLDARSRTLRLAVPSDQATAAYDNVSLVGRAIKGRRDQAR